MNQSNTPPQPANLNNVTVLSLAQIAAWQNTAEAESPIFAKVPSLQRGAIWNPGQVELLWDSILRGFPIGAFVVCKKLQKQNSRKGKNDRSENDKEATHHLLDGQQRANAIALGFDDPFSGNGQPPPRALLWLDLAPKFTANSTRSFLFRVTTEAHPWGYNTSDEAKSIPHYKMRTALDEYGKTRQDLKLTDTWPIDATAPVPFAWLMQKIKGSPCIQSKFFWDAIIKLCTESNKPWSSQCWVQKLRDNETKIEREQIFTGLNYANKLGIVALEVPEEVLKFDMNREDKDKYGSNNENITNVEHLFQRLNAGGTVLDGEELSYSMIKAYWPEVEKPIEELVVRRMPASRLVMLGTRAALSKQKGGKLQRPLTVSAMRKLALDLQESQPIRDFFLPPNTNDTSIKSVLEQVDNWLGDTNLQRNKSKLLGSSVRKMSLLRSAPHSRFTLSRLKLVADNFSDNNGLPPVLLSAMARSAPDVYLLLMWLADRFLSKPILRTVTDAENGNTGKSYKIRNSRFLKIRTRDGVNHNNQIKDLRKRLIGLATALHWFGVDRREAVAKLYETLNKQKNLFCSDTFKGILRDIYKLDGGKVGLHHIPTPDELDKLIILPTDKDTLKDWHWWRLARDSQGQELPYYQIVQRIKQENNLLLYAQRGHLRTAYPNYDPARQDLWEQHNRPWDYDHILPSKIIYYQQNIPNGVKEWAYSIANLRAWPMEDNRSDQAETPKSKLDDTTKLMESFIEKDELDGFEQGYKKITDPDNAIAFINSSKKRLLRIYREWYDTLDIGFLKM